jgi:exodeoxyribonuclease VII large subunit
MLEILSITDFCNYIKNNLPQKKFKISGEVNNPKISHGHLYLTLKDSNSNIKCIMWKSKLEKLKTKINDGDKLIIEGKIDFYSFTGSINIIIDDIILNEGVGQLQIKYDNIKAEFKLKGYFDNENKLKLPKYIKNILIITSQNGAAIQDFIFNLTNNNSNIIYTILDVPVQGYDCHKIISDKIIEIFNDKITFDKTPDCIVITRGGGSFQDLFAFSEPELIECVYKYKKIPILSAIGHQVDNP